MTFATAQAALPAGCTVTAGPAVTSRTEPTSTVRARRTDPTTSHEAAANASAFAGTHCDRILAALEQLGSGTAHEIGKHCGLTVEQACRRLTELQRAKAVAVLGSECDVEFTRDGYRIWRLA